MAHSKRPRPKKMGANDTKRVHYSNFMKCAYSITDHAIVQYIARRYPEMYKKICEDIGNEDAQALFAKNGDGKYPIGGCKVVITNGIAVTVY